MKKIRVFIAIFALISVAGLCYLRERTLGAQWTMQNHTRFTLDFYIDDVYQGQAFSGGFWPAQVEAGKHTLKAKSRFGCAGFEMTNSTPGGNAVQRIIPGKSIGAVYIGMPQSDVLRSLGNPSQVISASNSGSGGLRYDYDQTSLRLIINFTPIPETVVKSVSTLSNNFVTDEGIKVGSTGADVVKAYGRDYNRDEFRDSVNVTYPRLGIGFWLTPGNVVRNIYILNPE